MKGIIWMLIQILIAVLLGRKIWLDFKAVVDSYPDEQKKSEASDVATDCDEGD